MDEKARSALARLIPLRPWIALGSFLSGVAITIPAFYLHDLWLAILGAPFLLGGLLVLLVPLPYPR